MKRTYWKPQKGRFEEPLLSEDPAWNPQGNCKLVTPCVGTGYLTFIAAYGGGMMAWLFLLMRAPDGSQDIVIAYESIKALPTWAQGFFCAISLAIVSVTVDLIGRVGASIAFACRRERRVSSRRWALYRLAVQSAFLLALALFACLAPQMFPHPHGWVRFIFPAALLMPVWLAAVEWWYAMRGREHGPCSH